MLVLNTDISREISTAIVIELFPDTNQYVEGKIKYIAWIKRDINRNEQRMKKAINETSMELLPQLMDKPMVRRNPVTRGFKKQQIYKKKGLC